MEPFVGGKLIIVDERNVVAFGVGHRPVPRQGDVLFGFNTVFDGYLEAGGKLLDERPGGLQAIIIGDKDRVGELVFGLLTTETFEQAFEETQALVGANANCDVGEHGLRMSLDQRSASRPWLAALSR